ncbi:MULTISPECIES: glycoside hydrolase family 13 protein [Bifidobacterium]|uniref:glycoside hydrolase family 13 protein n=1 Tax=Bifidobacterium TaxID=1678 RepID=UPI0018DDD833|nr:MULTISPECIES: alpha-glucosidase [Bifidobacterium]MBH9980920.1 alpha-glucosidase [Bifidobacterium asteroides]MBI0100250.1 alpha-glucosidase [Bifidobacterium sp. W8114]
MTQKERMQLPDRVRTNGATPNPWWANAVVYQIYPRSFQDTNGDGYGDLPGITQRLDYLADLGVDVIWLSPVYKSPQDDNGYDIADYQDIDPIFGTMDDMDELLDQAHRRGIKVVMDLVVNHTSDEHAWFQASRNKDDPHADWYWWRPAKTGHEPGTPGAEPNQWGSYFGGSAWQYDSQRGEYYLHLFSKKQPDLNWENPQVRQAVFDMMNWWMDRGIDGFRMDVIVMISKTVDSEGRLPGEDGSAIADGPVGPEGYSSSVPFCVDGPRLDEFLQEMRSQVFQGRQGYLTVGEAPGLAPARSGQITDPANHELDMLFLFTQTEVDTGDSKWDIRPFRVPRLKAAMDEQQQAVAKAGWASLYFDNHDQPRIVSRWGDTSSEELRSRSAKALGLLLHMHRGTPYIYQGEELGMTNAGLTSLDQYQDLESINLYHQRVDQVHEQDPESMMAALAYMSRDNARTPMQWDSTKFAGFTAPYAPKEPWLAVNPNRDKVNAKTELRDPDSVLAFYRELIRLRHTNPVVAAGDFTLLDPDADQIYSFTRSLDQAPEPKSGPEAASVLDALPCQRLLVVVNLSSRPASLPPETAALLGLDQTGFTSMALGAVDPDRILISTYRPEQTASSLLTGRLSPWEGFVYRL